MVWWVWVGIENPTLIGGKATYVVAQRWMNSIKKCPNEEVPQMRLRVTGYLRTRNQRQCNCVNIC